MKVKLLMAVSIMMVGCATKEVESLREVPMVDIVSRTQALLAQKQNAKNREEGKTRVAVNEARLKAQDKAMLNDLGARLAVNGAKLEVKDGELVLWLPERIVFSFDDEEVKQYKTIQALAAFMLARGDGFLRITGHTDAVGNDDYNKRLGMRRAAGVAKQLIEAGVPAEDIIMVSQGADQPRVQTQEREALNRRSDLFFPSQKQ